MTNFEVLDNAFQLACMLTGLLLSVMIFLKKKKKLFFALACAYGGFFLGTLYYTMYLCIMGETPHYFYVAEVSWIAAYMFLGIAVTETAKSEALRFKLLPAAGAGIGALSSMLCQVMGPSLIISAVFAAVTGWIVYYCFYSICSNGTSTGFCLHVILIIFLQIMVFFTSGLVSGYSQFNVYFISDILNTLCWLMLLPHIWRRGKFYDIY